MLRSGDNNSKPIKPYLVADYAETASLRQKYRDDDNPFLIGISWWSKTAAVGAEFSLPLAELHPIMEIPGLRFISLQYGDFRDEVAASGLPLVMDSSVNPLLNMDRFASQVAAMDLVISIDNSTVSMATGLGKPVWNLVTYVPEWRMGERSVARAWHPTMRLFRQPKPGDWQAVIGEVMAELLRLQPEGRKIWGR